MTDEEQEVESSTKFAHFENVPQYDLYSLYSRHAEVARQIHEDTLRKVTGNDSLTVDLVQESPLKPSGTEIIDKLTQYDVVSFSSGMNALASIMNPDGLATGKVVDMYKKAFAEEEMPIYVAAAGNDGDTNNITQIRVADFGRNTLVVGEANQNEQGHFIEEHSSRIDPTLASDNPFNHGGRYQLYDLAPSLEGHEDLVRDWVIKTEINSAIDLFTKFNAANGVSEETIAAGQQAIYYEQMERYQTDEGLKAKVDQKVQSYMNNPESLHKIMFAQFKEDNPTLDDKGFVTNIDGTSFSGPEQAGYVSAAMYEQEQRLEQNFPVLTEDEITTLVKLATIDTTTREGVDKPMYDDENFAGHTTVWGAGHGVFQPEMFQKLLEESYKRIGADPDIKRGSVTTVLAAELDEGHKGSDVVKVRPDLPKGTDMVIDRMIVDVNMRVNGSFPHLFEIDSDNIWDATHRMQHVRNDDYSTTSWVRIEDSLGEELSSRDKWKVKLPDGQDATVQSMNITVYGYEKGGLMHQMMEYSKELARKMQNEANVKEPAVQQDEALTNEQAGLVQGGQGVPPVTTSAKM